MRIVRTARRQTLSDMMACEGMELLCTAAGAHISWRWNRLDGEPETSMSGMESIFHRKVVKQNPKSPVFPHIEFVVDENLVRLRQSIIFIRHIKSQGNKNHFRVNSEVHTYYIVMQNHIPSPVQRVMSHDVQSILVIIPQNRPPCSSFPVPH